MLIYKITNKINGKIYIGQTTQSIKKRWMDHRQSAKKKKQTAIGAAIEKHGADNFSIDVLCECSSSSEMNSLEISYIRDLNTLSPNGYNITHGGRDYFKHSQDTKDKLSLHNIGKILTDETRHKIGNAHRGRKQSTKWITDRTSKRIGLKHSVESKQKMSKNKGARPFIVFNSAGENIGRWGVCDRMR